MITPRGRVELADADVSMRAPGPTEAHGHLTSRFTGLALATGLTIAAGIACSSSGDSNAHLGDWKVTRIVAGSTQSSTLLGTSASYAEEKAAFGHQACAEPTYSRRWIAATAFQDAYDVRPEQLGLPANGEIGMIDVSCRSGALEAGSMLIVQSNDRMLTTWDGAYYELTRQ